MKPNFKLIICEENAQYEKAKSSEIENKHDRLFKDLFNDKEEVKNFIKDYINFELGNKEIEKCSNSYITGKYKNYEADIVYKIKDGNIYFLIEHQSTMDEKMPYRILNYSVEIYNEEIDKEKARSREYEYPLIIPIVLYTGKRKWQVERKFSAKIKYNNKEEKYIEMKYELVDVNNYKEEELLQKNTAISYAMLIEKSKAKETLIETLNKISQVSNNPKVNEKLLKIIQYILVPVLNKDISSITEKFKNKGEWTMKTLQDYFLAEWTKSGEEKLKEGRKQGERNTIKIVISNMLKSKVEIEKIKEYTGIDEAEIQKIAESI